MLQLTTEDYQEAAALLGCDVPTIVAVAKVESSGHPFIKEGYPTILFEGHVFWSQLKTVGLDPQQILATYPIYYNILYPKWVKTFYTKGMGEYDRLYKAITINEGAALCSASWGAFQIMGFNYRQCGYKNVFDFVNSMKQNARYHLLAFCKFMQSNKLVPYINNKDWRGFAYKYNGSGYASNKYDVKLALEYDKAKTMYA